MIYEIEITLRTIRREGLGSLFKKLGTYFHQLFCGAVFLCQRLPRNAKPQELVDFSFHAAGGLLQPAQVRSEIVQLAELVRQRQPKTIVEIGTAQGGTLFLWCRLTHPEATIVSIDLPGGIHGGGYPFWKTFLYKTFAQTEQKLFLIRANSQSPDTAKKLLSILGDTTVRFRNPVNIDVFRCLVMGEWMEVE
jgi:hypothetical protein